MKDEKKYLQLIEVINDLKPETKFELTIEWCASKGLDANSGDVRSFGLRFAKEFENHGCKYLKTSSDNLRHYKKNQEKQISNNLGENHERENY